MSTRPTVLERAFALATSGEFHNTQELRKQLKAEGYVTDQLAGPTLLRQLRDLCTASAKVR
jgi:hypothetical protein